MPERYNTWSARVRCIVTGASGFLGFHLCDVLQRAGAHVTAVVRRVDPEMASQYSDVIEVEDITRLTTLPRADVVFHLAGLAHNPAALEEEYTHTNVEGTSVLVRVAERAGIRRFIFMSSIKSMGEQTRRAFTPADKLSPSDAYGRSKAAAENILRRFSGEWVIVRTPMMYGPRVKGNFHRLLDAVAHGRMMPIGAIRNSRSLLYSGNCVEGLRHLATSPQSRFVALLSDGPPVSTPQMVQTIAKHMGVRTRLLSIPVPLLKVAALATGRHSEFQKLAGDLAVDYQHMYDNLGFVPPYSFDEAIGETVRWYCSNAA